METQDSVTRTIARVDKNSADVTQLSQDVDSLQSTIESFHIEGDVGDTVEYLQSQITQNANSISQTVSKLNGNAGDDGQYHAISQLKQTADSISSTVTANKNTETSHYNGLTSSINQQADRITSVITSLNDTDVAASDFSAIAQLQDNIELKVSKQDPNHPNSELVTQLNLSPSTIKLSGKLITLNGDTQVNGTFMTKMVQAGMIDAVKANFTSLSAITANFGEFTTSTSAGKVVIKGSLIEVWDKNRVRVRIGLW